MIIQIKGSSIVMTVGFAGSFQIVILQVKVPFTFWDTSAGTAVPITPVGFQHLSVDEDCCRVSRDRVLPASSTENAIRPHSHRCKYRQIGVGAESEMLVGSPFPCVILLVVGYLQLQ
ncbi:hypothetical protein L6164_034638 [Bauhinia variegata]|uniref:Uncharacterized protein n=1 Tax=Bauhinia variegata TaxID=167791 RepID=A0ACB9KVR0_BAUVA|nr:hypothetical protein L6164_034638 [Bauhinia variegata]